MSFLKDYRDYLLAKQPQPERVQYFWLALSAGIVGYVIWNIAGSPVLRSVVLLVVAGSIVTDAATNLSYFKNRRLFEKLVNVKIGANMLSLIVIVVFLVLYYKLGL